MAKTEGHFRDFDAELAEREFVPVSFQLGGKTFRCLNPMPLGTILVVARHAGSDDLQAQVEQAGMLWKFVVPEQHEDLDEAIASLPDLTIMQQILEHIITSATGRPTREP